MNKNKKIIIIITVLIIVAGIIIAKELLSSKNNESIKQETVLTQQNNLGKEKINSQEPKTILYEKTTFGMKNTADLNSENGLQITQTYENLKKSKKPFFMALSYEADCCEGTKRFFQNYHKVLFPIFTKYKGKITSFYLNVGKITDQQKEELMAIAQQIKLERGFPVLILFNANGTKKKAFIGQIDEEYLEKTVAGLIK